MNGSTSEGSFIGVGCIDLHHQFALVEADQLEGVALDDVFMRPVNFVTQLILALEDELVQPVDLHVHDLEEGKLAWKWFHHHVSASLLLNRYLRLRKH